MSNLDDDYADLYAEHDRLLAGVRAVLAEQPTCLFWACPGPDHPHVDMATCSACNAHIVLRTLIGDPPVCDGCPLHSDDSGDPYYIREQRGGTTFIVVGT